MVEPFLSDETSKSGKITFVENDGVEIITEENQNAKTCNTCFTNIPYR